MTYFPRVLELLAEKGASDIKLFGGGIIPDDDAAELKKRGVLEIFTPGASTETIVNWVHTHIQPHRG